MWESSLLLWDGGRLPGLVWIPMIMRIMMMTRSDWPQWAEISHQLCSAVSGLGQGSLYQSRKYEYDALLVWASNVAMLCIIWPVHGSIPKIYVCYSRMQKTLRISIKTWYLLAKGFVDNKIAMYKYYFIHHNKKMTLLGYYYQNDFSMKTKRRKEIIIVNGSYNEKSFSRKR